MLNSKHFPQTVDKTSGTHDSDTPIDILPVPNVHIENDPIGEEKVWLKGYRAGMSRYRRRRDA